MRVYVPLTPRGLASAHGAQELAPAPLVAYAVTPALREWYASEDLEELEYAALGRAARASLRLLSTEGEPGQADVRRVVAAVDIDDSAVATEPTETLDPEGLGEVRLDRPVPLVRVAALHVDASDAAEDVSAARTALSAADAGDGKAQALVDAAAEHELLWYATQELDQLV